MLSGLSTGADEAGLLVVRDKLSQSGKMYTKAICYIGSSRLIFSDHMLHLLRWLVHVRITSSNCYLTFSVVAGTALCQYKYVYLST